MINLIMTSCEDSWEKSPDFSIKIAVLQNIFFRNLEISILSYLTKLLKKLGICPVYSHMRSDSVYRIKKNVENYSEMEI